MGRAPGAAGGRRLGDDWLSDPSSLAAPGGGGLFDGSRGGFSLAAPSPTPGATGAGDLEGLLGGLSLSAPPANGMGPAHIPPSPGASLGASLGRSAATAAILAAEPSAQRQMLLDALQVRP